MRDVESLTPSRDADASAVEDGGRGSAKEGATPRSGQKEIDPNRPATPPQRRWLQGVVAIRLFVLVLAAGLTFLFATNWNAWLGSSAYQRTDNAYLQADMTPLAAKVNGYIRRVAVNDFQEVKAGDLLVEIEDDDYRAQVAQAEANVQAAAAAVANFENQKLLQQTLIRQAEATIVATESDVWRYHRDSDRQQSLQANSYISKQIADQALNAYQHSRATLDLNRAQLDQQRQQIPVLETQEAQARATLRAQQAALDLARINLGRTRIVAPLDGMVGQRQVRPSQYVGVGTQVISVVPLPNVWVVANYKETQMTRVRAGQPATVTVDAFPDLVLKGHVDSWSPATGSQFSLLPPDNATGNFTKVVQRVPVKIVIDSEGSVMGWLRPGMSVIATIDTTAVRATSGAMARSP